MSPRARRLVERTKELILAGHPIWRAVNVAGWDMIQCCKAFKSAEGMTPGEWARSLPWALREAVYRRTIVHSEIYSGLRNGREIASKKEWMCTACGDGPGVERPARCVKCGSGSFEPFLPLEAHEKRPPA